MKIEIINKERRELSAVIEDPEGYPIPMDQCIVESQSCRKGKGFYEEKKRIHLDGVYINFFKKSSVKKQESRVQSDSPYIQMHFELSGGAVCYSHSNSRFTVSMVQGEFSMFYIPHLDGTLIDPSCCNATSLEIQLSQAWIRQHIGDGPATALDFVDGISASQPTLLGGKNHTITPAIFQTINELCNCPYTGNIKRLYIEGKLLELLALQLYQTGAIETPNRCHVISKQDMESLHFIKEKILANLSKSYTIQELSYLSFMNRTKMQAGFKELFGCTIHEFIVENRMMEAYRLMEDDYSRDWNITEIAHRVGYRHYNHFSTAFKKRFGIPPSRFLKKL